MFYNNNFEELNIFIRKLVTIALEEDKKIIWGYGKGGVFLKYLLEQADKRIKIEYIIDDKMYIPPYCTPRIYRKSLLEYIEPNDYLLLSTILDYSFVYEYATLMG